MGREISDLEARLQRLREAHGAGYRADGGGGAAAPARRGPGRPPGRRPGRPPGSGAGRRPGRPGRPPGRPPGQGAGAKGGRKRASITPEQLASRQLQGRYLALVRQFPAARRAGFAKTAKEKGREAAIKEMQDAMKK